jgi:thiosulfate dehydrogenase (quinone) large subunit
MSTTLDRPTSPAVTLGRVTATPSTTGLEVIDGPMPDQQQPTHSEQTSVITPMSRRVALMGLLGLRLAIGFEFLWAFLDKTFGLGYSTPSAHAWINGGSPTTGFLSEVNVGPFQGVFHGIAGVAAFDWLFMVGLLGVGVALILGAAVRPAAIAGSAMLLLMYTATWPFATVGGGQPTGSTNPIVDDHIVSIMGLIVLGALAAWSVGVISRRWSALAFVRSHSILR